MKTYDIISIIPARGGSKRLSGKNKHNIWGEPMFLWPLKVASKLSENCLVCVSSDDPEILQIASENGALAHKRSKKLCDDFTYKQEAIRNAAEWLRNSSILGELYISLQANSPSIKSEVLKKGIDKIRENNKDEIFSVDENLMQNAAFRIFKGDYVYQKDLSTNCGVVICDVPDIHTIEDLKMVEKNYIPDDPI